MANINQQEQQRLALLEKIEQAEKRINAQNDKIAVSKGKEAKRLEKVMAAEKKSLDTLKEELKVTEKLLSANKKRSETLKKQAEFKKEILEDSENELKSFSKLSTRVKGALKDEKTGYNALSSVSARIRQINTDILLTKKDGKKFTDEDRIAAAEKLENLNNEKELLKSQREALLAQVESTLDIKDTAKGMSEEAKEELEYRESIKDFDEDTQKIFMNMFEQRKAFLAQEQKIKQIQGAQGELVDALPDGIKSIITTVKEFLTLVAEVGMVWAGIIGIFALGIMAMQELSKAAKKFREETGILNSQMRDIKDKAAEVTQEMAQLGVEAEDVYNVVSELKKEFGDIANISKDTVRALTILNSNFGVANEDATEFISQLQSMTGLSEDTAANYALQVTEVAKLAKVAPKQLFKDIAEAAKDSAEYFGTGFDNMAKTALEARRLGTTLKEVMGVSEKLLDFEGSIEQELKASAFAQGQFNLTQARALAATKNYSGALDEVLNQMERGGKFADKDLWTQTELAKTVGSNPAVIQKMIAQREKLSHLGEEEKSLAQQAIANGLDITNASKEQLELAINKLKTEQEMQGQLSRITNSFKGLGMVIGTAVLPFLEAILMIIQPIAWLLMGITDTFGKLGGILSGVSKALFGASEFGRGLFKVLKAVAMVALVAGGAMMALSGNVIGGATLVIAGSSFLNGISIDDGEIDKEGNVVSTKKGSVRLNSEDTFVGNKNGVVAGTNLFGTAPKPSSFSTQNSGQNINNLIAANTKAMNDLRTGGIQATAMYDMAKVNPIIQSYQSKTTRNNFNLPLNA
jgi:DNA repair exonuclease SbcCD ATPase subunit